MYSFRLMAHRIAPSRILRHRPPDGGLKRREFVDESRTVSGFREFRLVQSSRPPTDTPRIEIIKLRTFGFFEWVFNRRSTLGPVKKSMMFFRHGKSAKSIETLFDRLNISKNISGFGARPLISRTTRVFLP